MTGNEYQELAARTIGAKNSVSQLKHGVFGLCSEAGEVAGLLQKIYQGHTYDDEHMQKELGDVLWMVAEICTAEGFEMDDIMAMNIEKLRRRYPDGFESSRSIHREAGDI
jgi:NTP pyrophosphatase (non-canonical NTP hydrolase)